MTQRQTGDSAFDNLQYLLEGESGDGSVLARNLEDNPICTVSYDPGIPCLAVKWKQYATSTQLRYIHESLIRLIKKHRVSKILGDDMDLVSIAAVDQNWIAHNWMPRAITAGLKSVASIKPRAYFGQISVGRILSIVPVGLVIQSFDHFEDARNWLRNIYQPGRYRVCYRRFRGGGEPVNTYTFWCQEPSVEYFKQLARVALRGFWKVVDGSLEPVIARQSLPELIVIEGESGDAVCRWSLEDEVRELRAAARRA
jgi:hypothetical protein